MIGLDATQEQCAQALKTFLCRGCKLPLPGTGAVDVTVQIEGTLSSAALNGILNLGIAVAKRDMLFSLGTERVTRDLYLGRVLKPNGIPIGNLVTFRGKNTVIVRGVREAAYRRCKECGRVLYFSMIGRRHLHGGPPGDAELFESHLWGLVFSDEIARGLDLNSWSKVTHEILPVLDEPLDGYGDLQ
jgi:hypothetical protein